jgi:hypothetical protein
LRFGVGTHVALDRPDPLLTVLLVLGGLALAMRLGVLLLYRGRACSEALDLDGARHVERVFAIPYLTFAAALRPPRRRTRRFSSRYIRSSFLWLGVMPSRASR